MNIGKGVRSLSGYLIVYGVSAIVPFITMPIYTRMISPEDYGRLALAMIYGTIISGLSNLGTSVAYNREYFKLKQDKEKVNLLVTTTTLFTFLVFCVLLGLTIIFNRQISGIVTRSPNDGGIIIGASIISYLNLLYTEYCLNYWRNGQLVRIYMIYALVQLGITTVLGFIFIVFLNLSIVGILMSSGISMGGIMLFFFIKTFRWRKPYSGAVLKNSLKIGYPLTPQVFIGVLNNQFDKYIISIFGEMRDVGIYDIGKRISNQIFVVLTALQNVFLPGVYKKMFATEDKVKHGIGAYLTPFYYISNFLALAFVLFSEELIFVLLPKNYQSVIVYLIPLAVTFSLTFFGKITGQQLIYAKKLHLSMIISIISTVVITSFNAVFVALYGAIGAAFGNLIATIVSNSLLMIVSQRHCRIDWEWKRIALLLLILVCSSAVVYLMWSLDVEYIVRLAIKIPFFGVYIIVGNRFGILTRKNIIDAIKSMAPRKNVAKA